MEELEVIVQRMIDAGESEDNIKLVIEEYTNQIKSEDVAKTTAVVGEDAATPADTVLASEDGSLESVPGVVIPQNKEQPLQQPSPTSEQSTEGEKGGLESPSQITLFRNSIKSDINTLNVNTPKISELDKILQDDKKAIGNDPDLINNEEFVKNYNKNLEEYNLLFNINKSIAQKLEGDYIQRGYDSLRSNIPALKDLTFTTKEDFNNIQSEVDRLNNQIELDESSIEPDILTLNSSSLSVDLPYIEGLERMKSEKRNLDNSILELKKENDDILAFQEGYQYFKNGEEVTRSTMFSFLGSNEYEDLINKDLDKAKEIVQIKNDIPLQMLLHGQEIAGETGEYERTLNSAKSGFFNVFKKAPMSATASLINNFIDAKDTPKALEFIFGTSETSPTVSIAKKAYDDAEKQSKETGQDVDDLFTINYDTELKKISDDIRGQQLYKSQDIIDLYDEGDYTGFINGAAKLSVESSSYLAAAMIPLYGTGIIANSVAINGYYDLRRDGVSPEKAKVAAGLNSLVAVADNFIFRGMVSNTLKDASAVIKNAKKVRNITISNEVKLQLGKTALNNLIKEPSTEFIQGSTESMINQWAKGKPINYDLALRQGAIEASAAGPTTAVFSTIPGVQYLALKNQDFVKIQSINKQIEKLLSIDGESVLAENRNQQLKLLVDDYINIFETTETLATKSTKKEGAFLASLTAQEAILEKMINGRDVSDSQKKSLESRLKSISDGKNTMLDLIDKRPISEEEALVTDDQVVVFDGEIPVELKDVDSQSTRNVLKNGKLVERKVFLGKDLIKAGIAKKLEVKDETATETTEQPTADMQEGKRDSEEVQQEEIDGVKDVILQETDEGNFAIKDENENQIGYLDINDIDESAFNISPILDETEREKGIGKKTYLKAAEKRPDKNLVSMPINSGSLSPSAEKMWKGFVKQGKASKEKIGDDFYFKLKTYNELKKGGEEVQQEDSEVKTFAKRIANGEDVTAKEDAQFYENNKAEVEAELKAIQDLEVKAKQEPLTEEPVSVDTAPAEETIPQEDLEELEVEIQSREGQGSLLDNAEKEEKVYLNGKEGNIRIDPTNENTIIFESGDEIIELGNKDEVGSEPIAGFGLTTMPPEGLGVQAETMDADVVSIDGKEYNVIGRSKDKKGKAVVKVKEVIRGTDKETGEPIIKSGLVRRIKGAKAERVLKDVQLRKERKETPLPLTAEGKEVTAPTKKKKEELKELQRRKKLERSMTKNL